MKITGGYTEANPIEVNAIGYGTIFASKFLFVDQLGQAEACCYE